MRDAGIEKDQIDGISATMNPATLAHYLGIVPKWVDNTSVGGTSFLIHMRHAAAAIASGLATTILCCMGQSGRSSRRSRRRAHRRHVRPIRPHLRRLLSRPVRVHLRRSRPNHPVRHGRAALHERHRNHHRAARIRRRRPAQVVQQSPPRHVPRPCNRRRRAQQPDDLLPLPTLHVLPRNRRRRRLHPHQRRQGRGLPNQARLYPRNRRVRGNTRSSARCTT